MSYDPNRESLTEFISAWSSSNQTLSPTVTSGLTEYTGSTVFNLATVGEGDSTIVSSNTITPPEAGLRGFFVGDMRSQGTTVSAGDTYSIQFDSSQGDLASGGQTSRYNNQDDQCYSLDTSAQMRIGYVFRCQGESIAPWVRVLGVLV